MKRLPLDIFDPMPPAQRAYLQNNGWHFSRKACEYASARVLSASAKGKLSPWTIDEVDAMLATFSVNVDKTNYDYVYVANECKACYWQSAVADEQHVALYIADTLSGAEAADGAVMRRWYAAMVAAGMPVQWEDIL